MTDVAYHRDFLKPDHIKWMQEYLDEFDWYHHTQHYGWLYDVRAVWQNDFKGQYIGKLPFGILEVALKVEELHLTFMPDMCTVYNVMPSFGIKATAEHGYFKDNLAIVNVGAPITLRLDPQSNDFGKKKKAYLETGSMLHIGPDMFWRYFWSIDDESVFTWQGKEYNRARSIIMVFREVNDLVYNNEVVDHVRSIGGKLSNVEEINGES